MGTHIKIHCVLLLLIPRTTMFYGKVFSTRGSALRSIQLLRHVLNIMCFFFVLFAVHDAIRVRERCTLYGSIYKLIHIWYYMFGC